MKKTVLVMLLIIVLSGCSVKTPLVGELSDGTDVLMGEAVATVFSGTFEVSNSSGLSCQGVYDQYTTSPQLKTSVTCNDGRHGEVTILRTGPNLTNGSGIGKLNDGTSLRILIGDMVHLRNAQGPWKKSDAD